MRRPSDPLTKARADALLKRGATGVYAAGDRVYLVVTGQDRGNWVLRYNAGTRVSAQSGKAYPRTREMGLGAAAGPDKLSLSEALDRARDLNRLIRDGIDPLDKREEDAEAAKRQAERSQTFEQVVAAFFAAKAEEFAGMSAIHRHQWKQTLDAYALPVIGQKPVAALDLDDMDRVLRPIWGAKRETASRLRGRLQKVLDFATAMGWRDGFNPARLDGPLAHRLPGGEKKSKPHPSLPWKDAPDFAAALRQQSGVAGRALEFVMLTAVRTQEGLLARWSEIDLPNRLWTVPASRTKTGKKTGQDHEVPLSGRALELLEVAALARPEGDADGYVFPSGTAMAPLSDAAMAAVIKRMNKDGLRWKDPKSNRPATVHGMRATFRTWLDEDRDVRGRFSFEAKEHALGHHVGTKTGRAYARGVLFDERRDMMEAWAEFLAGKDNVVSLHPSANSAGSAERAAG